MVAFVAFLASARADAARPEFALKVQQARRSSLGTALIIAIPSRPDGKNASTLSLARFYENILPPLLRGGMWCGGGI